MLVSGYRRIKPKSLVKVTWLWLELNLVRSIGVIWKNLDRKERFRKRRKGKTGGLVRF